MDEVAAAAVLASQLLVVQAALLRAQLGGQSRVPAELFVAVCEAAPVGIDTIAVFDVVAAQLDLDFARRFGRADW